MLKRGLPKRLVYCPLGGPLGLRRAPREVGEGVARRGIRRLPAILGSVVGRGTRSELE